MTCTRNGGKFEEDQEKKDNKWLNCSLQVFKERGNRKEKLTSWNKKKKKERQDTQTRGNSRLK